MGDQIRAIFWAQFRIIRNYLPRTSAGAVLFAILSLLWYGIFAAGGLALAFGLPHAPAHNLRLYVSLGLLGMLLFWQIFPIMTLSTGRSLDLSKLIVYPIPPSSLFAVEFLLRVSTAPEMIFVLFGLLAGLMRHPLIPPFAPLWLLLYLPFNLFLSLAVREWMTRMFRRKRLRELLALVFVLIAVLPNLIANTSLGTRLKPVFFSLATGPLTPWHEITGLALGNNSILSMAVWVLWLSLAWLFANRQFTRALAVDHSSPTDTSQRSKTLSVRPSRLEGILSFPNRLWKDPLAALVEKELRILSRSPRFRVVFGMACGLSVVVFFPVAFGAHGNRILAGNYLPSISAYGLLIVGEILMWNAFGFDRKAAQVYFLAPQPLSAVFRAKNIVALTASLILVLLISSITLLLPIPMTVGTFCGSILVTLVLTGFFMAFGNLTSIWFPRPIDPNQTMRGAGGAKTSIWMMLCFLLMVLPVGCAFLARWAFNSQLAFFGILVLDLIIAVIIYKVATDSAIVRAERERERFLDALAKGAEPIGL